VILGSPIRVRMVRQWNRLSRETVDVPLLEVFKARLDGAMSNLVWLKMFLSMAGGMDQTIFKGPY